VDGDLVTHADVPAGLLESLVEKDYIACYRRVGHYTETGMWIVNCAHPEHKNFLDHWRSWYFSGRYRQLFEWHDCTTLDGTIKKFEEADKITVRDLSGEHGKNMHPQALSELSKYFDHCKGPRKAKGYSVENRHRKAA
jgi:hypothetical protein